MRTKKRLASLMLTTVILMSFGFPVSANNNTDTYYTYTLPAPAYYVVITPGGLKTDTSSTYVYFYSTNDTALKNYGVRYSVFGGANINVAVENCTSYVSSCIIYPATKRLIHQNVHELGYTYAFLGLCAPNSQGQGTTPDGLWSPDSTGTYPYAN